jgi:DNA-binding transcriptional MerR regulator
MANNESISVTPKYLIGSVTKLTGLSIDVIRVWERRYGAVRPARSDGGTRLYSDADIYRLKRLRQAVESGYSISQASKLTEPELDELIAGAPQTHAPSDPYRVIRERFIDSVKAMDVVTADQELARAATLFSVAEFVKRVVGPSFEEIRTSRERNELGLAHEKLAFNLANRIIGALIRTYTPPVNAATMMLATPAGERDELNILLPALLAAAQGWRVIYLGADLPADEIVVAVRSTKASVLLLGVISNSPRIAEELASISRLAPLTTRIWVNGVAVDQYKDLIARANWVLIRNLEELDERLIG